MPKLDKQGRLTIPFDFRHRLISPHNRNIAICYDTSRIVLLHSNKTDGARIIAFRKLDEKGRFYFPQEAFRILDANKYSTFRIYLQDYNVYIECS